MRNIFIAVLASIVIASCHSGNQAPDFVTYKTAPAGVDIQSNDSLVANENFVQAVEGKYPGLDSMVTMRQDYFLEKENFRIDKYYEFWNLFRKEVINRELSEEELLAWIDLTGFLFQLTADAMVAEELEHIRWRYVRNSQGLQVDSLLVPYAFTRHTDNVHVNLFIPSEIGFTHSLGGGIKVIQKTDFPQSGRISILFEMETKQYVELFIRIPTWAENAEVTFKGVKYLAHPGTYSKIAKKWIEGDQVEVYIPLTKKPEYL